MTSKEYQVLSWHFRNCT